MKSRFWSSMRVRRDCEILPGDVLGAARDLDQHRLEVVEHPGELQVAVLLRRDAIEAAGGDQIAGRRRARTRLPTGRRRASSSISTSSISVCWKCSLERREQHALARLLQRRSAEVRTIAGPDVDADVVVAGVAARADRDSRATRSRSRPRATTAAAMPSAGIQRARGPRGRPLRRASGSALLDARPHHPLEPLARLGHRGGVDQLQRLAAAPLHA